MGDQTVNTPKAQPDVTKLIADLTARVEAAEGKARAAGQVADAAIEAAKSATPAPSDGMVLVAEALRELKESNETGPIKQIPFHKAKVVTPWDPTGKHLERPQLTRDVFLNNHYIRAVTMNDAGIRALNQMQPGRYTVGGVVISVTQTDNSMSIGWSNKNRDVQNKLSRVGLAEDIFVKMVEQGPEKVLGPQVVNV